MYERNGLEGKGVSDIPVSLSSQSGSIGRWLHSSLCVLLVDVYLFWLDAADHAAQRHQSITHMLDMFLVLQANRAVGPWMTSCGRVMSASIGWRG